MARSHRSAALGIVLLVVLAGCVGGPGGPQTTTAASDTATTVETTTDGATDTPASVETTAPAPTGVETTTDGSAAGTLVANERYVFDHYGVGSPAIEGGIRFDTETVGFYATLVTSRAETERFDRAVLDDGAREFVDRTDFDGEVLVVVQALPASSAPDYRVERATRDGDHLHLRINDSSRGGTNDVTVETLLVRVALDGDGPPTGATITTEEGVSFETGAGVVTRSPPTTTDEPEEPTLPYASDDPSANVDEPLDLRVLNAGSEVNGYDVTVTYVETPACRNATPPCGQPTREVVVLRRIGKLQPDEELVVTDAVARKGDYRVTVEAFLPDGDGGRRTVRETVEWRVGEGATDLTVRITDERVERG